MTSWKTTVSGILAVLPQILHILFPKVVTLEVASAITSIFVLLGFVAAKDKNVTGGTTVNTNNSASAVQEAATTSKIGGVAIEEKL